MTFNKFFKLKIIHLISFILFLDTLDVISPKQYCSKPSPCQDYRVSHQFQLREKFMAFCKWWKKQKSCTQSINDIMKQQEHYFMDDLQGKVFIVLAMMIEIVEATMPITMIHLLPKIWLSLKPSLIVKPAQSITSAPAGVQWFILQYSPTYPVIIFQRYMAPTIKWIKKPPNRPQMAVTCLDFAINMIPLKRSISTCVVCSASSSPSNPQINPSSDDFFLLYYQLVYKEMPSGAWTWYESSGMALTTFLLTQLSEQLVESLLYPFQDSVRFYLVWLFLGELINCNLILILYLAKQSIFMFDCQKNRKLLVKIMLQEPD